MLRVVAHKSAAAASQYYAEGLKREDYYSEGQETIGKWYGKAADRLGLSGEVTPEGFAALVENRHPGTGERLTPRTKADRIVGYDINFHAPKSLSILHALTRDDDILKAFRSAVAETMAEIEKQAATRIRQDGAQENRSTGNLVWAEFIHFTARPVGGIPDPHLHVHNFVFNATFDSDEDRWKAAKFRQIKQEAPYSEAAFHARLASKIAGLGYGIKRTVTGWEIDGIPRTLIDKFSRRTAQIERQAEEKGITDPKLKDGLGALTREGKRHGLVYADLLGAWGARLTDEEKALISSLRYDKQPATPDEKVTAGAALDYAFEKLFSKNSVVEQNRLVGEALHFGVGHLKPEQVWRELAKRELVVRKIGDQILCTSLDVLAEEVSLINHVRSGRGQHAPLQPGKAKFQNELLSPEQRRAVSHILNSKDQVIAVRGAAGVGKTTLMKEAANQIEVGGFRIFAFAPSASASRETLRKEGFEKANTVAHLLQNKRLQEQIRGQVIWIDEAGLLGVKELWEVMKLAGDSTRVILTGDSGQHAPVSRGDAFRLLQKYAGLKIAEVTEIRRQEQEVYKKAVSALSRGDLANAFASLDELGAIVEVADEGARYRLLAADFLSLSKKGSAPLVVSPTHAESAKVTDAIREALREAGQLKGERSYTRYHNLQWENADKRWADSYREGLMVQFHQNAAGINRGEIFHVTGRDGRGNVIITALSGREIILPLKNAERFQVFEARQIELGKGERIRITRNGESLDGKRLNNGDVHTIEKIKKNGDIVLSNGAVLDAKHGHFNHGYCQTSHSSQSKSIRDVLVAQSEESFVASSKEQFYVSVSRGKESIRIYTDSRQGLQQAVGNSSVRQSGIELAGLKSRDIAAMSDALSSSQFRDRIKQRHIEGETKTHVKALLRDRKQGIDKKPEGHSWRQYLEMRKGLVGPDGKSRSKGTGGKPEKGQGNIANRYRSNIRPTELTSKTTARMKEADAVRKGQAPEKPAPEPTKSRLMKAYESAAQNFKKVLDRVKPEQKDKPGQAEKGKSAEIQQGQSRQAAKVQTPRQAQDKTKQAGPPQSPLPQSTPSQAADHQVRQTKADAAKAEQTVKKTEVKTKPVVPPPPAPKK